MHCVNKLCTALVRYRKKILKTSQKYMLPKRGRYLLKFDFFTSDKFYNLLNLNNISILEILNASITLTVYSSEFSKYFRKCPLKLFNRFLQ